MVLRAQASLCPVGVSNSIPGSSKGEHRGVVAWHTPACLLQARGPSCAVGPISCILLVSSVGCKCFLFLSYVSWCYGILIPLDTKPNNDVFVVTDGFLWTMQWFIFQTLRFSDMQLSPCFCSQTLIWVCVYNTVKRIASKLGNSHILWANIAKSSFERLKPYVNHIIIMGFPAV